MGVPSSTNAEDLLEAPSAPARLTGSAPLRTAVLGCGLIGRTHAEILRGIEGSELVGVCDAVSERAKDVAAAHGVRAFTDLEAMLRSEHVEMLSVCTPHPTHADAVVLAARHGVHCLVEKPLAPDLASCDRAIAASERHGLKLAVVSQRRWYPPVRRMKEAIDAGRIGEPVLATLEVLGWRDASYYASGSWRGSWRGEGGGVLLNQTCHQLDLLQWLMGPVCEVYGRWDNFNHPFIEVDDTATAVIRFEGGGLGSVVVSNAQRPGLWGTLHVHGSNGASIGARTESGSSFVAGVTQRAEPPLNDLWTIPSEVDRLAAWQTEDRGSEVDVMTYYHALQVADFLDAVRLDRPPAVDGREGRKAVEIVTAVYRSQRDGQPVRFPLAPELGRDDFDGRTGYEPLSHRERPTRSDGATEPDCREADVGEGGRALA